MALSDEEQRLLDQMEAALAAEDPKLVNALRGTGLRRVHRRRAAIAGVGFFAGLALLVAGMSTHIIFSVLGFVLMVVAAVTAIYSWQHVGAGPDHGHTADRPKAPQPSGSDDSQGFMDKMEERWRRRRDESGF
ncbi:MAG TPA: DUF3040 domain-containing protein [Propionibacteriaceae bacterium]|nr:DUF3040 domain-containing protein [Propionibacteriaceae bacterium]